ncbi:hypothetical protein BU25DRAFT_465452, partial [Macroventuria anomochaeta]
VTATNQTLIDVFTATLKADTTDQKLWTYPTSTKDQSVGIRRIGAASTTSPRPPATAVENKDTTPGSVGTTDDSGKWNILTDDMGERSRMRQCGRNQRRHIHQDNRHNQELRKRSNDIAEINRHTADYRLSTNRLGNEEAFLGQRLQPPQHGSLTNNGGWSHKINCYHFPGHCVPDYLCALVRTTLASQWVSAIVPTRDSLLPYSTMTPLQLSPPLYDCCPSTSHILASSITMSSIPHCSGGVPPVVLPSPIAQRVAPSLAPRHNVCLRCAKHIRDGLIQCNCQKFRKCDRCSRLKKACLELPQHSIRAWNTLVLSYEHLRDVGPDNHHKHNEWEQACRRWIADVKATERGLSKRGGTRKSKGDEIQLLQVDATTRLAVAVEGILDVLRAQVCCHCPNGVQAGYKLLGELDAPTVPAPRHSQELSFSYPDNHNRGGDVDEGGGGSSGGSDSGEEDDLSSDFASSLSVEPTPTPVSQGRGRPCKQAPGAATMPTKPGRLASKPKPPLKRLSSLRRKPKSPAGSTGVAQIVPLAKRKLRSAGCAKGVGSADLTMSGGLGPPGVEQEDGMTDSLEDDLVQPTPTPKRSRR